MSVHLMRVNVFVFDEMVIAKFILKNFHLFFFVFCTSLSEMRLEF